MHDWNYVIRCISAFIFVYGSGSWLKVKQKSELNTLATKCKINMRRTFSFPASL